MGVASAVLIVLITILFPPIGVWAVAGCGMGIDYHIHILRTYVFVRADLPSDLFINICLTILGYIPGHIHAFYLEYIYYDRREQAREGRYPTGRAPGVYSENVQTGGQGYGTIAQPVATATSHSASAPCLARQHNGTRQPPTRRLFISLAMPSLSAPPPPSSPAPAPPSPTSPHQPRHKPSSSSTTDAFPFSFNRLSRANPSSTRLVPSIAQGRPIPLDDSTAEHRTSALREINNHYPSRHRYANSSGAQSSTYSEPVIVRSYRPPVTARRLVSSTTAGPSIGSTSEARGPAATAVTRVLPFAAQVGNGALGTMVRLGVARAPATQAQQEARLPPVEAFSFKSFMTNTEASGGDSHLNADLDRIAEICARSRYSLSNQYEVHYAPHGSGTSFLAGAQPASSDLQGPTLQAVSSDDERNLGRQRRRRQTGRRNSRAMGTLETIMSSSRSSDEERPEKRSAAEIADDIRGRASRDKEPGHSSPATSSRSTSDSAASRDDESPSKIRSRRPSTSLALIDSARQNPDQPDASGPKPCTTTLVGEPALPQASTSHLELRTAPEQSPEAPAPTGQEHIKTTPAPPPNGCHQPTAKGSIPPIQEAAGGVGAGRLTLLGGWLPWTSPDRQAGRAEGRLRHLLKTADYQKGKAAAVKAS
ncbi:hypothetical protein L249_6234 [Ophiocordyceps polyrhachis-furcata BCC 54312]|uniref:Uncharacterized protein n=1 Tax=Ophiocordyceps polyrhachis-furcata BCC 54312 TaxID=1330021 RepID=A0A367L1E1_9HYPO|nr:hypothetical protein L249_6234 [Ophiocordyceps polyrhachis-furcata BCC 54312]